MRTTREGPQHRDPQGGIIVPRGDKEQRGDGRRPGRRPLQKAGGSRGGGRCTKRGAAQQAAVAVTVTVQRQGGSAGGGRYTKRGAAQQAAVAAQKQGGSAGGRYRSRAAVAVTRYRRPLQEAGCQCRRPLQEKCPGAGCPNRKTLYWHVYLFLQTTGAQWHAAGQFHFHRFSGGLLLLWALEVIY
jgi:hypothetical protein